MKELADFPEWRRFTEANDRLTELVENDPDFARIFQEGVLAEWDHDEEKATSYFKEVEDRGIPIGEIFKAQIDAADAVFSCHFSNRPLNDPTAEGAKYNTTQSSATSRTARSTIRLHRP